MTETSAATATLVLLANSASTWFLTGLIWTIQVVHYPLFAKVGRANFVDYESFHTRLITLVVGPAMLIELLASMAMLMVRPRCVPLWTAWLGLAMLAGIWISTATVQVPMHAVLSKGFDDSAHARLVTSNWIRTILWSGRAALLAWCMWSVISSAPNTLQSGSTS